MKARLLICVLVIFVFGIDSQYCIADDFDWPRWRGINGDGISLETDWDPKALAGGPKILWKADVGAGYSNVAIKDNRLYTMGQEGKEIIVSCLNAETGEKIWNYSLKSPPGLQFPQSTPTIDDKFVYALCKDGLLLCIKTKNGKVRWEKNLVIDYKTEEIPYGYSGSPVIEGDLIILNVNTAGIALDKKTGDLIWASNVHTKEKENSDGYHATPVIYDYEGKRCALLFSGTGLFTVEVETGKQMWFHELWPTTSGCIADPIVFENRVHVSTNSLLTGWALLGIKGNEPKVVWQKNMRSGVSTNVLVDGNLYGSEGPGGRHIFKCVDWKTGEIRWEQRMKGAPLIAADGKLIILEEDGTLHIAEATPSSYQEISSCDVLDGEQKPRKFWTPPVLCNEKIYCRNVVGDLVCIDVSK